jgi:5-methylcytosine-specific restriction protein A
MPRATPEWIGKTPDAAIPKAVRARVFARYRGKCYLSGRTIRAGDVWELEHIKPLSMGGAHAEMNLAPALQAPHREKSAREAGERAKADRCHAKHFGYHEPKSRQKIPARADPWGYRR